MPLFFRISKNGALVAVKQVTTTQATFGRDATVSIVLDDPSVSPFHAMVEQRNGDYFLTDMGSEKGTFRNGTQVVEIQIQSGDQIGIGAFQIEFSVGVPKPKSEQTVVSTPQPSPPQRSAPPPPPPSAKAPVAPPAKGVSPPTSAPSAPKAPTPTPIPKSATATTPARGTAPRPTGVAGAAGMDTVQPGRAPTTVKYSGRPLKEIIKASKGTTVEVIVGWGDRILNNYHFNERKIIYIGSHPKNDIILPIISTTESHIPFLKLDDLVQVFIPANAHGELTRGSGVFSIKDLIAQGKLGRSGTGYLLQLQQEELLRLDFDGSISLFIRYVGSSPKPMALPWIDLTSSELMTLIGAGLFMLISAVLIQLATPNLPPEEDTAKKEEPPRKVRFEIKKERAQLADQTQEKSPQVGGSPQPDEKKVVEKKGVQIPHMTEPPAEAKPNNSQAKEKKPTGANVGKTGVVRSSDSKKSGGGQSTAPKQIDISKMGILGAFGGKGAQSAIEHAVSGADAVGGISRGAGGKAGFGQGDNGGATEPGLKSVGAGGKGTATIGVSGVNTKGRGGGVTGYGDDTGIGGKKSSVITAGGAEESFQGTIDREAIRRVVKANQNQLKACYERALNRDPGLYGKIVLEWVIGAGGHVDSAKVKSSTMGSSEVEQCCVARLKTWRFPDPPKNQEAVVSYPFTFNKD